MVTPNYFILFHIFKVKYLKIRSRLCAKNIMNFHQAIFSEKNFLENIPVHKKGRFWGIYPLIIALSDQSYD